MLKVLSSLRAGPKFQPPFQLSISTGRLGLSGAPADGQLPFPMRSEVNFVFQPGFCFILFLGSCWSSKHRTAVDFCSLSVGCGGSGVPEVSGGIRGSWATLPKSKPFIFGRFEGPRFRFSVFSFRFRLVICWVGVLLIPTILFENFQRNAGNATAKQDSTCRVYRYFN